MNYQILPKIKSKYLKFAFLILLLFLPFKDLIEYIFVGMGPKLMIGPKEFSLQIKQLQKQNVSLLLKVQELEYLKEENIRLQKALKFKEKSKTDLIGCEVISFDPSAWRRIVNVGVGKNAGIKKGSYAINEEGALIGKIAQVKDNYSRLTLISDPDFSLAVFIGENTFGLLKGGLERIKVLYIEDAESLKVKDKVWVKVSSLDSCLYIGEVKKISKNKNNFFWDVEVKLPSKSPLLHKIFIVN